MIDVCSGGVIVLEFTRFEVYCPLDYWWYPFDIQVMTSRNLMTETEVTEHKCPFLASL